MATVYLSSTFRDLKAYREAVIDQLLSMGHTVRAMEYYTALDQRPVEKCVEDVLRSDIYLGCLAWRYGHVPAGSDHSVTEHEYRAAEQKAIPRLMFLVQEDVPWPPTDMDLHTGCNSAGANIKDFRARVQEDRLAKFFRTPDQLAAMVAAALVMTQARDVERTLQSVINADALSHPEMLFTASGAELLASGLKSLDGARALTVDLRDNNYWWSTRLYALATIAAEFTSVEWLVFVEGGGRYVGMVRPSTLRRALAQQQPELDRRYFESRLASLGGPQGLEPALTSLLHALDRHGDEQGPLRFGVSAEWLRNSVPRFERARVGALGPIDPRGIESLLAMELPFVAVVDQEDRLAKIVDRVGVATELASCYARARSA